jgi:hypothetical protein
MIQCRNGLSSIFFQGVGIEKAGGSPLLQASDARMTTRLSALMAFSAPQSLSSALSRTGDTPGDGRPWQGGHGYRRNFPGR